MQDDLIKSLNPGYRDLYAEMVMRSLRGSWIAPKRRAKILVTIGEVGGCIFYDDDKIKAKAESYLEQGNDRGHWDGRTFRHLYGEVEISEFPEKKVRELASHIPDDETWGDYKINRVFDNE